MNECKKKTDIYRVFCECGFLFRCLLDVRAIENFLFARSPQMNFVITVTNGKLPTIVNFVEMSDVYWLWYDNYKEII